MILSHSWQRLGERHVKKIRPSRAYYLWCLMTASGRRLLHSMSCACGGYRSVRRDSSRANRRTVLKT